jgi:hypothetical protein
MKSFLLKFIWALLVVLLGGWCVLVLLFSPALPESLRVPAGAISGILLLLSFFRWKRRALLRGAALTIFVVTGGLWASLQPSSDRDWTPESTATPWAEIKGDEVTIHNVRNFTYRSEEDYDPIYEDRTVNLSDLSEVDIVVSYWAGKAIAHIMVSFGFKNKDFLAVSIETRKEQGEAYSAVKGFFRNYELTYVVADERDVIGVRTNHRNPAERVYVLRTRMFLENGKKLFLNYMNKINELRERPAFYNTFTTNCTTQVLAHVKAFGAKAAYNWKILFSGYVPEYLFEGENLMPGLSLEEIMSRSLVNESAQAAGASPDFSVKIREGVPHPTPRDAPVQ